MAEFRKCQDCSQPYDGDVTSLKAPIIASECPHSLCRHCLTKRFDVADNEEGRYVTAIKCPICNGYLDPEKSVSYDHVVRRREEGTGDEENCQLTHPYCNQSIKN